MMAPRKGSYEIIASTAAVFESPTALYTETNPANVSILRRLTQGAVVSGSMKYVTIPGHNIKAKWIQLDDGGFVLPDLIKKLRVA